MRLVHGDGFIVESLFFLQKSHTTYERGSATWRADPSYQRASRAAPGVTVTTRIAARSNCGTMQLKVEEKELEAAMQRAENAVIVVKASEVELQEASLARAGLEHVF